MARSGKTGVWFGAILTLCACGGGEEQEEDAPRFSEEETITACVANCARIERCEDFTPYAGCEGDCQQDHDFRSTGDNCFDEWAAFQICVSEEISACTDSPSLACDDEMAAFNTCDQ